MNNSRYRHLIHVILIPAILLWCYPFIWMVTAGFKTQSEMFLNGLSLIPRNPTLENFVRAWNAAKFEQYFLNTVIVTFCVVALVIIVSATAGYALSRQHMAGRKVIVLCLVSTMFLPKGFTIIPVFELIVHLGLNNSLAGVILAEAGPAHIVGILLFIGYFASLPRELEESAAIDGASYITIFTRIIFPLAKPITGTLIIFNFIAAWNSFFTPLVFTLSKPKLRTLGVGMYSFFGEHSVDWTGLAAGACITVVPIIIVFLLLQRYFIEGLAGAVKG